MLPLTPLDSPFRSPRSGPYVIAEIGVNHEGRLDLARRLIDEAVEGGADCVKFQTYKAHTLAARQSPSYWDLQAEPTTSQYELFKKYDGFEPADYAALAEHARVRGVTFCSTPFDLPSVEWLAPLVPFFKIASADLTNLPLLRACAAQRKPIVLSVGASYLSEVEEAVRVLAERVPAADIVLLHCVLEYPTPYEHANLSVIEHLVRVFPDHAIGYSDHTRPDPAMAVLLRAWMLGAVVLEKHFTHDKTLPGNDHYHAMDRDDLRRFRESAALLLAAEGSGRKTVLPSEATARQNARRSLVAVRSLPVGHQLTAADLIPKRPAFGLPTSALEWVLGRPLRLPLEEDGFLTLDHLTGTRD
ncbi:MAG: N-acetylneuraminate synthase family protein [Polyangiaceae bacterium]|nr:N-acetylneuraminate synthase family protein [Polyangiaceae bacterium]